MKRADHLPDLHGLKCKVYHKVLLLPAKVVIKFWNRIDLAIKACYFPRKMAGERKRLFLGVGDEVTHKTYNQWGVGVVIEVMTSVVPGGTCLVRIRFQDGQLRTFNNDLDSEGCCYYFGVRRYWNPTPRRVAAARSKHFLP